MKRGEIYWATLVPRSGSEQMGTRPVLIVSHDGFNETPTWRSIIVVPLTTSDSQARRGPTVISLPAGVGGLTQDSIAICHQITTLDRSKLTQPIGELSSEWIAEVEKGMKAALALD